MGSETTRSSGKSVSQTPAKTDLEVQVVEFLRRHPDFFSNYPQLLVEMEIPHDCGPATSLVEHQVHVLKQQATEMRSKFKQLMDNARQNEELNQRIHQLVLALVQTRALDDCLAALYQGMAENFGADMISLRIFAQAREMRDQGLGEFVAQKDCDLFHSVFSGGHPVCGQATSGQLEFLFQEQAQAVASTALVPIRIGYLQDQPGQSQACALLAIGSRDAARFQPGMGTVYLHQLAELLGQILHLHVM